MIDLPTHPWMSGLFGDDEMAAIFAPEADLQRFLQVEAAWTNALGQIAGSKDAEGVAEAILAADIAPGDLQDGFAQDGVPIPALVTLLKSKLGNDAGEWIHVGMTSQDVMDTALVLTLRDVLALLSARLGELDERLADLQNQFGPTPVMAITRMQAALPTTASDMIARWRQPIAQLMKDCTHTSQNVSIVQWGGPIGVRDHPQAEKLGRRFADNLNLLDPGFAWHTDRTQISAVGYAVVRIATVTGKIGEDIALMAALGPSQMKLMGGASSAMPHKNNPVKAEALITLSDLIMNLQSVLSRSTRHEGFRSGQAWMLEWLTLPQMCIAGAASLRVSKTLLSDIESIGAAQ